MSFNFFGLMPGDPGITQTVNAIRNAVDYGLHQHQIRQRAETLIASCPDRDEDCEVRSIFNWVQNHFHYVRDPRGIEMVKSPEVIDLEISEKGSFQGDCDDITAYLAALLKSVGFSVKAVVISIPGKGDDFRHIFPIVYMTGKNQWVALEGTSRRVMGWQAPQERRREYDL